ncbi:MAG TPA: hydroxymethylbilane synthase [Candidatus Dormibacteraeota bacterium]
MSPAAGVAVLRLATRGSTLARAQAALAASAIEASGGAPARLVIVRTGGDRNRSTPIDEMEGQGWFTAEIERSVLAGAADIAVHSAKDLPTTLADGLEVVAHLPRADPCDALVTRDGMPLDLLEDGATVGTSSARRSALLAEIRPGLRCVPIRGNVDTRLGKLAAGEVDALLVAAAAMDRLGLSDRITQRLDPRQFVPAPGQGAIALEAVCGSAAAEIAAAAGDATTRLAVDCERAVLLALGGGCLLPLGVWARLDGDRLVVSAALGAGGSIARVELGGNPDRPGDLAVRVAGALR